ncbi:MAG: potassium transporter TrkG [Oscillospiraceae bacterium]
MLYLLYFLITAVLVGMLLLGGMPLFDSLVHAFGTVGTGGFGIRADSIASYSPYIQGVITVFMILCGINFNLYYLLLLRQWRAALRSDELWTYLGLAALATGVITLDLRGCTAAWAPACGRRRFRWAPSSPPPAMPRRTSTSGRGCPEQFYLR